MGTFDGELGTTSCVHRSCRIDFVACTQGRFYSEVSYVKEFLLEGREHEPSFSSDCNKGLTIFQQNRFLRQTKQ